MTSALTRRSFVAGLPLTGVAVASAGAAFARQARVVRVSGEVTDASYRPLAALLLDSFDKFRRPQRPAPKRLRSNLVSLSRSRRQNARPLRHRPFASPLVKSQ